MSARRALAVAAALVISTLWSAASAIAVLLGVAHILSPPAPPPPRRIMRSIRRARPKEREPTLLISPTLTDEPEALDDLPLIAIQRASLDQGAHSPPHGRRTFSRSLKRMMSLDTSQPSQPKVSRESQPQKVSRGRSPSLSPVLQRSPTNSRSPARQAKDRHAISAEVARAAWVDVRA